MNRQPLQSSLKKILGPEPAYRSLGEHVTSFNLLRVLLATDAAYIAVHCISYVFPFVDHRVYDLANDNGPAEGFMHVKLFWILCALAFLAFRRKSSHFFVWATFWGYLFLDDVFSFHERGGRVLVKAFDLQSMLGPKAYVLGEILMSALPAIVCFPLIWFASRSVSASERSFGRRLLAWTLILAVVGIFADAAQSLFNSIHDLASLFKIVEDGGEMIVVSFVLFETLSPLTDGTGNS